MCVEMAKPEIQSTIFASRQLVTQRVKSVNVHAFYSFTHLLTSSTSKTSDVINDVIDYFLCFVSSNKLLLVLQARHHMKTKCALKRCVKWALATKLLLHNFLKKVNVLNNLKLL